MAEELVVGEEIDEEMVPLQTIHPWACVVLSPQDQYKIHAGCPSESGTVWGPPAHPLPPHLFPLEDCE